MSPGRECRDVPAAPWWGRKLQVLHLLGSWLGPLLPGPLRAPRRGSLVFAPPRQRQGRGGSPAVGLQERLGTFSAGGREVKGQLPVLAVARWGLSGCSPAPVPALSLGAPEKGELGARRHHGEIGGQLRRQPRRGANSSWGCCASFSAPAAAAECGCPSGPAPLSSAGSHPAAGRTFGGARSLSWAGHSLINLFH